MAAKAQEEDEAWEEEEEPWHEDTQGSQWQDEGDWEESWWQDSQERSWEEHGNSSSSRRGRRRSWNPESWEQEEAQPPAKRRAMAPPPPAPAQLTRWESNGSTASSASNLSWSDREWPGQGWRGLSRRDKDDIEQWLECTNVGAPVPGTRIVPCKTPFEGGLADSAYDCGLLKDDMWFGKQDLLDRCEEQGTPLGLVIDLVNTTKYYAGFDDGDGVEYCKVQIPGRQVPARDAVEEIFDTIDEFLGRRPDMFVGLHCTHGVNRTGFVVAAYLMTRCDLPEYVEAVSVFEKARGHKIDKPYLLQALRALEAGQY